MLFGSFGDGGMLYGFLEGGFCIELVLDGCWFCFFGGKLFLFIGVFVWLGFLGLGGLCIDIEFFL